MFLNMLDTLVGPGACATLSPRRTHLLPKIDPLYTHHVLSAMQFDALKRTKPSLCLNNRHPFWVNRVGLAHCLLLPVFPEQRTW
jgi:hypothetical protein